MVSKSDERQRAQWVAEWRASGLTVDEFAARSGISANTLRYWAYRREKAVPAARSLEVVRVERQAAPTSSPAGAPIVVEVDGTRLIVPAGADGVTLRLVLDAVRASGRPA